jgi:hypothetical protein
MSWVNDLQVQHFHWLPKCQDLHHSFTRWSRAVHGRDRTVTAWCYNDSTANHKEWCCCCRYVISALIAIVIIMIISCDSGGGRGQTYLGLLCLCVWSALLSVRVYSCTKLVMHVSFVIKIRCPIWCVGDQGLNVSYIRRQRQINGAYLYLTFGILSITLNDKLMLGTRGFIIVVSTCINNPQ